MTRPIKKLRMFKMENAQTMVEFALVFPIVLLLTYGLIEFGRMIFTYTAIIGAAREGARYGAAAGTVNGLPQFADCSGIQAAVISKAFLVANPTIAIQYDAGHGLPSFSNCASLNPKDIKSGYRIEVTVSNLFTPWIAFLGVPSFTMSSTNYRTILVNIPIQK